MPVFSNDECDMIEKYVESFSDGLKKNIVVKLQAQIGYKLPSELDSVLAKLSALGMLLKKRNGAGGRGETVVKEQHDLPEEHIPVIKRVMLQQRRQVAAKLEEPMGKTFHPELLGNLEKELEPIKKIMDAPWFQEA